MEEYFKVFSKVNTTNEGEFVPPPSLEEFKRLMEMAHENKSENQQVDISELFAQPNPDCYRLNLRHELVKDEYAKFREERNSIFPISDEERDNFENRLLEKFLDNNIISVLDIEKVDRENDIAREQQVRHDMRRYGNSAYIHERPRKDFMKSEIEKANSDEEKIEKTEKSSRKKELVELC